MKFHAALVLALLPQMALGKEASAPKTDSTATLRVQFVYQGSPVTPQEIKPDRDVQYCGRKSIPNERLVVNAENQGIQNVMLYASFGRSNLNPLAIADPPRHQVFQLKDCRLQPRVLVTQVGDTLEVINRDKVGHNLNIQFFNNLPLGITIPPGGPNVRELLEPEPVAIPVECNIHPWIKGQLLVLNHRLAAISNDRGSLEIKGLPVGKVTFRVSHESLRFESVIVNGERREWRRQRVTIDLHAGINDFGTVKVHVSGKPGDAP